MINLLVVAFLAGTIGFSLASYLQPDTITMNHRGMVGCARGWFIVRNIDFELNEVVQSPGSLDIIHVAPCDQYNRFTED